MSTRTKFILATLALLLVFVVMEYRMPRKFRWEPTFAHHDPQPFGCMVFDSVLAASMPQGYAVEHRTLWQMEQDSVFATPKGVLIITKEDIDAQIKKVLDLASRGNTMLVATTDFYNWCDTLGIDYGFHRPFKLSDIAGKAPAKGSLRLVGEASKLCVVGEASRLCVVGEASRLCVVGEASKLCTPDSVVSSDLSVYQQLIERTLIIPDSVSCEVLARFRFYDDDEALRMAKDEDNDWCNFWQPVAAAFPIGKGELILVSAPLLLTNYGMVSGDSHRFIAHLMGRMQHLPVIRTESYMAATAHTEQSPLYVLLQRPPLRWAIYLTMLTLLLFCIFTARRRQRVIPVFAHPRNANLEFVRLIGTLYWQRHDNADLVAKKLAFTIDALRRDAGIDLSSGDDALRQLAALTGRDPEELRLLLRNIREAASGNYTVSDQELKTYIDQLDSLLYSL